MLFGKIIKSFLYDNLDSVKIETKQQNINCSIHNDMVQFLLYESYIPIDAMVFEIGVSNLSNNETEKIIKNVLKAKRILLKDPTEISKFVNFEEPTSGNSSAILNFRNKIIEKDKSFIYKNIIMENLKEIYNCLSDNMTGSIADPGKDKEYREMILRIKEHVVENLNINKKIELERNNFYRNYIDISRMKKEKISLNLAGTIFSPKELAKIIYRINIPNKKSVIRKWINNIFKPLEELEYIKIKSITEQKFVIIDFIKECITQKRGNYDEAIETRNIILKAAKLSQQKIEDYLKKQSLENKRILKLIENTKDDKWILKFSKQIKEDYINYLLTLQDDKKKTLLNHFND